MNGASRSPGGPRQLAPPPPNILDILHAVKAIASDTSYVDTWWLARRSRLDVKGKGRVGRTAIELVVEGRPVSSEVQASLSARLSMALRGASVTVRFARSPMETQSLFRLLSTRKRT